MHKIHKFVSLAFLLATSPLALASSAPVSFYAAEGNGLDAMNAHSANVSAAACTTGKVGQAFHFTGPSQAATYIDFGGWFAFESFTVAMWIKDDATVQAPQQTSAPIMHMDDALNGTDFVLKYNNTGNQYQYTTSDGASPITFSTSPGTWQYLVITRNGTSKITSIYLGGQLVGSGTGTGDLFLDPAFVTGLRAGADFNLTTYWKGELDEVRFYDRSVSAAEVALLSNSTAIDVVVPGNANPYLAGMPAGTTTGGDFAGDPLSTGTSRLQSPVQVPGLNLSNGAFLTFSAAGSVNYTGGTPTDPADGVGSFGRNAENGLSGATYPLNTLVGVFLDDNQPDGSAAPASLDFSVAGATDYTSLSPVLKQVFFIGDGVTSGSAVQQVNVPSGATRLFLATTDGTGWFNNTGNLSVRVTSSATEVTGTALPSVAFSITGSTSNGSILHFGANTGAGLAVRVQSSSTPAVEASWLDLPDGHNGAMTEDSPGNYSLPSTFYPAGSAVSLRAIASKAAFTDSISAPLGPFVLTRAILSIGVTLSSSSDPIHASVTHIGDDLTYTFTAINSGSATARSLKLVATVPTYIENQTNLNKQFASTTVTTISSGGSYHAASNGSTLDAQIIWDAGDLDAGSQLSKTFTIHISANVRLQQSVGIGNDYTVYGSTFQPPYSATGFSSGSPNVSTPINGPISFTMVRKSGTVAPGGLITYTCTLTNFTSAAVANAAAVVEVPEGTRFAEKYPTGPKTSVAGVAWATKSGGPDYEEVYWFGKPNPRVVIPLTGLAARGDTRHRDVQSFNITFQAQWTDPSEMPTIGTSDYGAVFFDPTSFKIAGITLKQATVFSAAYKLSSATTASKPGPVDFFTFIDNTLHDIAVSKNESGIVNVALTGSIDAQPKLALLKAISNRAVDTEDDGSGSSIDTVTPGEKLTYVLGAINQGTSEANDVYFQDGIPENTSYVLKSAKVLGTSASSKASDLKVVPDADGHHLRFEGLHMAPNDTLSVEYSVVVASGSDAPLQGTFITPGASSIGSTSTPHTPPGITLCGPVKIVGQALFAQPGIRPLPSQAPVSTNVIATANALTAAYATQPNALQASLSQRFYVHYENIGTLAATGVKLDVALPAHTAFYRASFVKLVPSKNKTSLGGFPGQLINPPSGSTVIPPSGAANGFLSVGGTATFTFNKLAAGAKGDVMLEVIVSPDVVTQSVSLVGDPTAPAVRMHDSTVSSFASNSMLAQALPFSGSHQSAASFPLIPVLSDALVPQIGIVKLITQQEVKPGDEFQVQLIVSNYGGMAAHPIVNFTIPANTEFVSASAGQSYLLLPAANSPGNLVEAVLASNNGPVTIGSGGNAAAPLLGHTAAALTITLKVTGAIGSAIVDSSAQVTVDYMGKAFAAASSVPIVAVPVKAPLVLLTGPSLFHVISNTSEAFLMDLGGGNIVASGGGNIVASGGGNIVATGGGNIVATGGGNLIHVGSGLTPPTGASLLANQAGIVAAGGGNIMVGQGGSIVAAGGGNIVAAGGGNIVASGGGNIVAAGGGNLITNDGGSLLSTANIVATGGGNALVRGAGNIVAAGGGNIVAAGGGNILGSTPGSSAGLVTRGGAIVAAGGGNFAPTH